MYLKKLNGEWAEPVDCAKTKKNTTKEAGVKGPENVFSVLGKHGQFCVLRRSHRDRHVILTTACRAANATNLMHSIRTLLSQHTSHLKSH